MSNVTLTEAPVLKGIEAIKDADDGSKFTLRLRTVAYVGSTRKEVTFDVPSLAFDTWDGTWWASEYPVKLEAAYLEWELLLPA